MKTESKTLGKVKFGAKLELRDVILLGMVIAIKIILGKFTVGSQLLQVGLGFIGSVMLGYLFGPLWGFAGGAISDLVNSAIFGNMGGFFIGFTLTAAVGPMIYGFFFYKKPVQIWRVIAATIVVAIVCNIGMNTLWLHIMYNMPFMKTLGVRIVKEMISPWIQMVVTWFVLQALSRVDARLRK